VAWVPIVIFVACLGAGTFAASRWLPDLARGTVGGLSFYVVCGLLGAMVGVVGLRIYWLVELLTSGPESFRGIAAANGLEDLLWQSGLLLALAAGVYLLAPPQEDGLPAEDLTPRG
jgi:hypothetical protein